MDNTQQIAQLLSDSIHLKGSENIINGLTIEDWDDILTISGKHHVTPILYHHINTHAELYEIPASILEKMNQAFLSNVVRNTLLLHETESILERFSQAGIRAVGLKGLFLIENVYPEFGMRTMSDMDILLKKADIPKGLLILEDLGYQPSTYFDINDQNIDIKHVPPFIKGESSYVEIHWTLLEENEPFSIDTAGVWERAIPAKIAGVEAAGLSIEDLILHLCIHLTYQHHLQLGFRGLYDIALVIIKYLDEIDWCAIVERAEDWQAEKVIALTFQLLNYYFNLSFPDVLIGKLLKIPIPEEVFEQACKQISLVEQTGHFVTPDLANLPAAKGLFGKLKLIISRVFLPKQVIARIYNINPKSVKVYFYYPVRLWDLWRHYKNSVKKIVREEQDILEGVAQTQAKSRLRAWLISDK